MVSKMKAEGKINVKISFCRVSGRGAMAKWELKRKDLVTGSFGTSVVCKSPTVRGTLH